MSRTQIDGRKLPTEQDNPCQFIGSHKVGIAEPLAIFLEGDPHRFIDVGFVTVDLVYANVGPRLQRCIDVFATLVLLFVVTVQTYTLFDKVRGTYADNVSTFDLRLPVWPFFLVAWIGDVSAVLLIAVRTYRLIFHPELLGRPISDQAGRMRRA